MFHVPYLYQWYDLYSSPIGKTRASKNSSKFPGWALIKQLHAVARSRCSWPVPTDSLSALHCWSLIVPLFNRADVDIWFADESGFEGDPRPRKRWDKKGRKTRVTRNGGHLRINVIDMVCPRSAEFFAIEPSHSDSATYQAFLDEADKSILFQRTTNIMKKNY